MKYLSHDTFTVVSADNIDFMHSYVRIFCGHQRSSWHGTTVQAIQPLPSLSLPEGLLNEARLTDSHAGGSPLDPPGGIRLTDSLASGSPLEPPGGIRLTDSLASGSPLDTPGGIRLTDSLASGSPLDQPGVSQKRKDTPLPSPQKLTRSLLPKIQKRHRTGTEGQQEMGKLPPAPKPHLQATQQRTYYSSSLVLSHFRTSGAEKEVQGDILRDQHISPSQSCGLQQYPTATISEHAGSLHTHKDHTQ